MAEFLSEIFEDVRNENGFRFLKLYIDDKCQFEEFYNNIREHYAKSSDAKSLDKIIALMDSYGAAILLPKEKFRAIKNSERSDVFEFKNKSIRVYVVIRDREVYIVMAGYKNNQDRDVARLMNRIKEF